MNYPVWDVPVIGSGWVIGGIAIFHVMISHFAVGGGFYLPMAERKAILEKRDDWMEVIRGHAKFFLILTSVFGAVSGVGIWFAIGLANPESTSTLIHNFVFGWAIEWCFFIIEITAAAVYYYTWGKIDDRTHLIIGWIYAGSAWLSLVIINGILTFMLTPGEAWLSVAGTGNEASRFWHAFFNPTYWPSLVLRTLICISLAGIWAFVTASRIDAYEKPALKQQVMRWSALWLIPAFVMLPLTFAWYLYMIPSDRLQLLQLGIDTIGSGAFTHVTRMALVTVMTSATIIVIVYALAWRNPRDFTFGHAVALLLLGLTATAATESSREMLRKPYTVAGHMYSNGMRVSEVGDLNANGYATRSPWISETTLAAWAVPPDQEGWALDKENTPEQQSAAMEVGALMFRGQCLACHTVEGYRSLRTLFHGRDRQSIANILAMLHGKPEDNPYSAYMPPLAGTGREIDALTLYLDALFNPSAAPLPKTLASVPASLSHKSTQ